VIVNEYLIEHYGRARDYALGAVENHCVCVCELPCPPLDDLRTWFDETSPQELLEFRLGLPLKILSPFIERASCQGHLIAELKAWYPFEFDRGFARYWAKIWELVGGLPE
jgi:hypothetical protein